jgi:hypothetical protein
MWKSTQCYNASISSFVVHVSSHTLYKEGYELDQAKTLGFCFGVDCSICVYLIIPALIPGRDFVVCVKIHLCGYARIQAPEDVRANADKDPIITPEGPDDLDNQALERLHPVHVEKDVVDDDPHQLPSLDDGLGDPG